MSSTPATADRIALHDALVNLGGHRKVEDLIAELTSHDAGIAVHPSSTSWTACAR